MKNDLISTVPLNPLFAAIRKAMSVKVMAIAMIRAPGNMFFIAKSS
jgi:hypothetical protein